MLHNIIEIIKDVPLLFPTKRDLKPKELKIYNEIAQNPITTGAGVISAGISEVDYESLGVENMGKMFCT